VNSLLILTEFHPASKCRFVKCRFVLRTTNGRSNGRPNNPTIVPTIARLQNHEPKSVCKIIRRFAKDMGTPMINLDTLHVFHPTSKPA